MTPPSVPTVTAEDRKAAEALVNGIKVSSMPLSSQIPDIAKMFAAHREAAHKAGRLDGFTAGWWAAMEKAVFIIENFGRNKPNLLFSTRTDLVAALREAATPAAPEKT